MGRISKKEIAITKEAKPKKERKLRVKEEEDKSGIITYHNRDPKIPKDVIEINEEILKDETKKAEFHKMLEAGEIKWIYYAMGSKFYKKITK
jgi:hypothetical protein